MPCEIGTGFHNLCSWAYGGKGTFLESTGWTAAIVVVIIMLFILNIYPAEKGASGWKLAKLVIYSFLATFAVLSVHKGVVLQNVGASDIEKRNDAIIESIGGSVNLDDAIMPSVSAPPKENHEEIDSLIKRYDV